MSYSIVRMYQEHDNEVIETDLTLDEAQAHCSDDETSSRTCEDEEGLARTALMGAWFDGYEEE